ncbi:unnamed protein product [Microthlaspi erraticum]|uniref:Uncharacterized protein n=1 Tax=Microthlaspi erraticum TaxID=1685480 RepID=A0A6D2JQD9_9BRAS|nr:unnamed protein product [Microthlaspi erraticum]
MDSLDRELELQDVWVYSGEISVLEAVDERLKGEFDEEMMKKLLLVYLREKADQRLHVVSADGITQQTPWFSLSPCQENEMDRIKNDAKKQIVADFFHFIENFNEKPSNSSRYTVLGAPVFALSACLRILDMSISEIDSKTLKFVVDLIHKYKNSKDEATRDRYREILSETLSIISRSEQLYTCQEMDSVITELQKLFISETGHRHHHLYKSKPNLALFLSGLSKYEISENETCTKSRNEVSLVLFRR